MAGQPGGGAKATEVQTGGAGSATGAWPAASDPWTAGADAANVGSEVTACAAGGGPLLSI